MPFGVGPAEVVVLLVIALLVFGPKRLPEMGRSLGRGMREFKDSISGNDSTPEPPAEPSSRAELSSAAKTAGESERVRDAAS